MKSSRSVKSIKSLKDLKILSNCDLEKLLDLQECFNMACNKFNNPPFIVLKEFQKDDAKLLKREASPKYKKIRMATPGSENEVVTPTTASSAVIHSDADEKAVRITAVYDKMNHLVEMSLYGEKELSRQMIQMIGLIVPYFRALSRISIKKSRIEGSIIHELGKILVLSSITDICLDDSPFGQANYALLLKRKSQLNNLSLCRCRINDEVCRLIAAELHFGNTAETCLNTLNLSSNHITDVGANYIAEALRTNRRLRYLNLADNRISDEGACRILDTLIRFPLTYDEIVSKRRRYHEYWKTRQNLFYKYLNDCDARSLDGNVQSCKKPSSIKKRNSATTLKSKSPKKDKSKDIPQPLNDDYIITKADTLAAQTIGPFVDPYSPTETVIKDNYCYCQGNLTLSYLNLSYNELTYVTVKKLKVVIIGQNLIKKPGKIGLIKIQIEGNNMPVSCDELRFVEYTLNRAIASFGGKTMSEIGGRKKSLSTRISCIK